MKLKTGSSLFFLFFSISIWAQTTGNILGNVQDQNTAANLEGVHIFAEGTTFDTYSDSNGNYILELPVGTYTIVAFQEGYGEKVFFQTKVSSGNDTTLNMELSSSGEQLDEVVIETAGDNSARAADMVTPLSVQKLTIQEIQSNPGGNFDVSKVVQALPGVGLSNGIGERNDIIIRGGAPNENVYYLDGVEIPVLNHFQTQGSSGGAQGILNVSFIENLKLTTSAFDAKYNDALSSTFVIKQRDGNPNRFTGNGRVSVTESALTLEGPLSSKTTFLASARKSYLGLLFKAIDLPIRPNFSDFQYKVTHKFNDKTTLSAIGIGAIDNFKFAETRESTPENLYTLRSTPYINQWTYTTGFTLNHKIKNGYLDFVVSRNMFRTKIDKFEDEQKIEDQRTLRIKSDEIENKFRFNINQFINGWKLSAGTSAQYVGYSGDVFNKVRNEIYDDNGEVISPAQTVNFDSKINFWKYGVFAQAAKRFFDRKLLVSAGGRTDMNSFTNEGNNPLKTLSPRLSLSYRLHPKWNLNASTGIYYKVPVYTALGFKDETGDLINKDMDYTRSAHYVLGTEFLPKNSLRFTLEGFYKRYTDYPISENTGISLANQGTEFGSVGSERILTQGKGEAYGFELFAQKKMTKNLFYTLSYSFVVSKFSGLDKKLISSSWDNRHLFSGIVGYSLPKNWEIGMKYRYAGGNPFTPFDMTASQQNYMLLGQGIIDVDLLNEAKLKNYSQLDLRVDKTYHFKNISLNFYLDMQNILMAKNESNPSFTFKRNEDNSGFVTTDGQPIKQDGSNGIPVLLKNDSGRLIPNLGVIIEF